MTATSKVSDDKYQTGDTSVRTIVGSPPRVGGRSNNNSSVVHAGE